MFENRLRSAASDAVLVVVDMQEKLTPAMHEMHHLIHRVEVLVRGCALLGIPVLFTQQYTKGLGETIAPIKTAYLEAASSANANVRYAIDDQLMPPQGEISFSYIEKNSFSAMDEPAFVDALEGLKRNEVILCGIESHVCVMQTALDLYPYGYPVKVAMDATASRRVFDYECARSRMVEEGIKVTTSEALLFDYMRNSAHPAFRQISALVR
ncbi:MAG: isochorismatase family protein [Clostridiales Family XIII bacterium]|jgi:nicotinamidase-related amidase|nr:isochorismatase family protein [Clostridiales Family XIII bacterium]